MSASTNGLKTGWYAIESRFDGAIGCIFRTPTGEWDYVRRTHKQLPSGWVVISRVDDLLRDAAWYRWLREPGRLSEGFVGDAADAVNVDGAPPERIDAMIDAEIAREPHQ